MKKKKELEQAIWNVEYCKRQIKWYLKELKLDEEKLKNLTKK